MKMVQLVLGISCFASIATAQPAELPPPPGKLISIGERRLHLLCSGQGAPTIVLEAGASSFAIDWTLVQRDLEKTNRVCSYDRAGMGWSDPPASANPAREAEDLHALLTAAGEAPPYVITGASRGGLLIRDFLARYPSEILGLVFVDPSTEDNLWLMLRGQAVMFAAMTPEQLIETLPKEPVTPPRRKPQTGAPFDRLPPDVYRQRVLLDERLIASVPATLMPEWIGAFQERERLLLASLLASRKASSHPFGERPTVVLSRGSERSNDREASHGAVAKLSTNARHSIIAGAGHEIHLFEPAAVVLAIRDVLQAVRDKAALPARPD
jgi:pimeloyl-ACP methyl ester carboxylesterase